MRRLVVIAMALSVGWLAFAILRERREDAVLRSWWDAELDSGGFEDPYRWPR